MNITTMQAHTAFENASLLSMDDILLKIGFHKLLHAFIALKGGLDNASAALFVSEDKLTQWTGTGCSRLIPDPMVQKLVVSRAMDELRI